MAGPLKKDRYFFAASLAGADLLFSKGAHRFVDTNLEGQGSSGWVYNWVGPQIPFIFIRFPHLCNADFVDYDDQFPTYATYYCMSKK